MRELRVFTADDHAFVRAGIKALVDGQDDMSVVGQAADGITAIESVRRTAPNVVLLDISMPGLNGIEVALRLKREFAWMNLMALTMHDDRNLLRQFLGAGGSGYLLKHALANEVIRAIRIVGNGGTYVDPTLANELVKYTKLGHSLHRAIEPMDLSEREEEVLRLVAQGYTNKEISVYLDISPKRSRSTNCGQSKNLGSRAAWRSSGTVCAKAGSVSSN
jgi:DNA-binding NarL/FixJ family response regulator